MKKTIIKKSTKRKIIKGCKGAVSLFMVVMMVPFLQIAFALLEVGRYNSTVSLFDEAAGVSATSTLASFDKYLEQRWGLLAVDQGKNLDQLYKSSLDINGNFAGGGYSVSSIKTTGINPLSEGKFLYNQIIEYSKLNVPTKLAKDVLHIADLVKALENIGNIGKILNLFSTNVSTIDSAIDLVESAEELKTLANDLDTKSASCDTAFTEFKNSVSNLVNALKVPRPTMEEALAEKQAKADKEAAGKTNEDGTPVEPEQVTLTQAERDEVIRKQNEYDNNISNLRTAVTTKKNAYKTELEAVSTDLKSYKEKMSTFISASQTIQTNTVSTISQSMDMAGEISKAEYKKKEIDKKIEAISENDRTESNATYQDLIKQRNDYETGLATLKTQQTIVQSTNTGLKEVNDGLNKALDTYNEDVVDGVISGISTVVTNLNNLNSANIKSTTVLKEADYKVSIGGYVGADKIDAFLDEQEKKLIEGTLKSVIDGIKTFINSIFNMSLVYEPALSAVIDTAFYRDNLGGLPGEGSQKGAIETIIESIGTLSTSSAKLSVDMMTMNFLGMLKEIKAVYESAISLLNGIKDFAIGLMNNIAGIFTSPDRIFYSTYATYMLPCRTNLGDDNDVTFSNLTGYSLKKGSLPKKNIGSSNLTAIDDFAAAAQTIKAIASGSGSDLTFSGAELEYILFGNNSEIANQTLVFFTLYIIRLLLDLPVLMCNAEVQSIAGASTFGYPIVIAIFILAEPLADSFVLVNGGSVSLLKTKAYLTPTGLPSLIATISSIITNKALATTEQKKALESNLKDVMGVDETKYQAEYKKELEVQKHSGVTDADKKLQKGLSDFLKMDYRQHCFVIMLLFVEEAQLMARLSNLIQMETLYYYKEVDKGKSGVALFDMKKSFSYINVDAKIKVKKMLPTLLANDFEVERKIVRGY